MQVRRPGKRGGESSLLPDKTAHHSGLLSSRSFDVDWRAILWLLVSRVYTLKVSSLPSHVPKIWRQYPEQEHFHVVYEVFVLEDVPTEVIPGVLPPPAVMCGLQSVPDISLADVNWRRAVVEDVNSLPAFTDFPNVFDVLGIPSPHFAELVHQCHRASAAGSGSHDHHLA